MKPGSPLSITALALVAASALACGEDGGTAESSTPSSANVGGANVGGASVGGAGGASTTSSTGGGVGGMVAATTSSGGNAPCAPGATRDCYSGSEETRDVGACKSGVETCLPDGSAYGPCEGEVLPTLETCLTLGDDDCDGKVNEAGEGCVCKPKSTFYCYEGDPKTENVGLCVGGTHTCSDDGTAWGPCVGQVLPAVENCSTPADEDCDGATPLCTPTWLVTAGDATQQFVNSVAVDVNDNVVVAGQLEGAMTLGGTTLTSLGFADAFVAKFDKAGTLLWAFRYGEATSNQAATAVAVDPQGNVFVTGYFRASINFGASTLTSAGGSDVFVAKLDGATGAQLWAVKFGNNVDDQLGLAITCDAAGNPYVAGAFAGQLALNPNVTSAGLQDAFVTRLNGATGAATWGARFGGVDNAAARAVALDANGDVVVVGDFFGSFVHGGVTLTSSGASDVIVARFNGATGVAAAPIRFGGSGFDFGRSMVATPSGTLLAGEFEQSVDFGNGAVASAGGFDMFVVERANDDTIVKSTTFGGAGDESAFALALDANFNLLLAGFTTGTIDFGAGPVTSAGGRDILAAKLDSDLKGIWTRRFGDATFYQQAATIAVGKSGDVVVGGHFSGTVDFGLGNVMTSGGTDAFVLSFPP